MNPLRGEVWWANLAEPRGSEPGFRHPLLIVQADSFNRSRISTVLAAVITSNLNLSDAPGNVRISRKQSKLTRDSVVNVSQVVTIDRRFLRKRVSRLPSKMMIEVDSGLRLVIGLGAYDASGT